MSERPMERKKKTVYIILALVVFYGKRSRPFLHARTLCNVVYGKYDYETDPTGLAKSVFSSSSTVSPISVTERVMPGRCISTA